MTRVKKPLAAIALSGLSLAMVAACSSSGKSNNNGNGGSSGASSTGGSSASSAPAQPGSGTDNSVNAMATTDRAQVKQGGNFTWAISQTIPNFNYYEVDGTLLDNSNIINALLPRPFHFSASGVPSVNTDYYTSIEKTSDSPQTIEYKINPKAKWSDGTPITWEDLKDLWVASNGKNTAYKISGSQGWDQIASVTRGANDQDAIVKFSNPYTDWQSLFDPLVPKSLTSSPNAFNTAWTKKPAVTAGPFMWGGSDATANTYTIKADPNWWGDKPKLDSITYVVYNDPATAVQALGSKGLDYDDITFGDEVANVAAAKKYSGIEIHQAGSNIYRQFTINTKSGLLTDEKVRQAVVLGINRQLITTALEGALGGNPTPLQNHFFMKNQAPYTETCGDYCKYDPAKAQQLLQSDGWTKSGQYFTKNGKELDLTITIPAETPNALKEAQIAQATLKAAGIKLTPTTVPSNDFFPKYITVGKFDLTTFTWIGTAFPVGGALSIFKYDPKNIGQNYGSGGNDAINALLQKASTSATSDEENKLANEASQQMWSNASWLPLYQKPQAVAVNGNLVNIGAYGFADVRYQDIGYKA
ncbi:MAG: ABC transporter family substrate-binding protein [Jatrophihabitans sp.]|uniref:ABC transporter family substrate-binding protein n=1 Tax=Jatrophihabitans sp. TaxID=1932789 RepID=UPI003F7F1E58